MEKSRISPVHIIQRKEQPGPNGATRLNSCAVAEPREPAPDSLMSTIVAWGPRLGSAPWRFFFGGGAAEKFGLDRQNTLNRVQMFTIFVVNKSCFSIFLV